MTTINANPNQNVADNLANIPNFIENVVNQYIVRPTGNGHVTGISGFVFDILGSEVIHLDSDITDHYIEDNTAVQDQISLKPERFSLTGYVGEINDIFQASFLSVLTAVQSLGTVGGLLPDFSAQATQLYNSIASVASQVAQPINQARNLYDIFTNNQTTATRQQQAYVYFYGLWSSRTLVDVETPFGIIKNMAIESIQAKQDETTKFISDFTVSFKRIRTSDTIAFSLIASVGKASNVVASAVTNGQTSGPLESADLLTQAFGGDLGGLVNSIL